MHRGVGLLAMGLWTLAMPALGCEPRLERGWADVGGGTLRLVMERDGEACGARVFASSTAARPAERLAVVTPPAHGSISFGEGRFTYTPEPGYSGADRFELRGQGPNRNGTMLPLRGVVEVLVRNRAGAAPVAAAPPAQEPVVATGPAAPPLLIMTAPVVPAPVAITTLPPPAPAPAAMATAAEEPAAVDPAPAAEGSVPATAAMGHDKRRKRPPA